MVDKAVQVAIGSKRPHQTATPCASSPKVKKEDRATQCGISQSGSYGHNNKHRKWRYDDLVGVMADKEMFIHWLMEFRRIPKFGVRKHLFSTYLAEFMWRYTHRGEDLFAVFLNDVKRIYLAN